MVSMEGEAPETVVVFSDADAAAKLSMKQEYFDHIRKVNDVFYDQIKISDQKAAYIFTFMIAFLVSSADVRAAFALTRYTMADLPLLFASFVLAVGVTVALVSAILVVLPRRSAVSTSLFWGTWPVQRTRFQAAADANDGDYLFGEYVTNADTLASIASAKYRFVSIAFRSLVIAVLAYLLVLFFTGSSV
ncbi:hypothetical protein GCM10007908_16500 [Rhizobium albus]|nr:hypothetical protein GCM10007908_16500 [Rhizobium albus]